MVMEEDEETNNVITHHDLLRNRMAIQNNVVNKRKEQLRAWEKSEMNKLPAIRKPPSTSHVKFQDSDIFFSACVSGDEDEVEDLLDKGANVNTTTIDGVTALHQAVIDNKFEMVRFLVNHGADINAQDNEGWTPLHAAVCCGNILIIRFLCDHGADITVANSDKELAVDLAEDDEIKAYLEEKLSVRGVSADECRGYEERMIMRDCMEWIRAGNYLDKPHHKTGATALHVAASKGYNKLISLLVQAGADVNAQDYEGWTPLHAAAHWGEKDACRILINRGGDISKRTIMGQDVLQVADTSIVEFLEQASSSNTSSSISSIRSRSITPEETSSSSLYSSDQSVAFTLKIPSSTTQSAAKDSSNSSSTTQSSTASGGGDKQAGSSNNDSNTTKKASTTKTEPQKEPPPPVPPKSTATTVARIASPSSEGSSVSESSTATMSSRRPRVELPTTTTPKNTLSTTSVMTTPSVNAPSTSSTVIERINANLTTPTIASATRQRPQMIRSASTMNSPITLTPTFTPKEALVSNPWVKHRKSTQTSIQQVKSVMAATQQQRTPSVASSTSSTTTECLISASSTPSTSPAPGFKPSVVSQPVQSSPGYKKYIEQNIRSWQTPPQQPTPQKESEAERKAKSRLQRASRRSTQGVTLDQLNEARSAASSPTVATTSNTSSLPSTKNEDIGKWKSTTLQQQQSSKATSSRDPPSGSSDSSGSYASTVSDSSSTNSLKPAGTGSVSSTSKQIITTPTLSAETPSASKMQRRRSDLKSTRRGASPVDAEMLSSISSSSISSSTTGRDLKQSSTSLEDGIKSPTAIVQPMQNSPTPAVEETLDDVLQKPYSQRATVPLLQDRVNSISEIGKKSNSDDGYKPLVIPRTLQPSTFPRSDSFQNGVSSIKDATLGSTGDNHYKTLYEKTLEENGKLRKQIEDLKLQKKEPETLLSNGSNAFITVRKTFNNSSSVGSHSPSPTATNSSHLDDSDRRTYERKIAELEYELQKAKQIQSDHKRLKDENNALIRVISKLSKDYPRQTITTASSAGAQTTKSTSAIMKSGPDAR